MDETTFDAFYRASFARLVGQLYAMCGSQAEAQDCVQEAFIRAWERRSQFAAEPSPEAWIRTVAYRLAVSRWRRVRGHRPLAADYAGDPGPNATHVALGRALAQLPADQRRAIVLHYLVDASVGDVAREMGVAEGTVKSWLSRGRATLAGLLGDDEEESNHV